MEYQPTDVNQRLAIARANLRANLPPDQLITCDDGPLCPDHGDPRDTNIIPTHAEYLDTVEDALTRKDFVALDRLLGSKYGHRSARIDEEAERLDEYLAENPN